MANNYLLMSAWLNIPVGTGDRAREICAKLDADEDVDWSVESGYIWFKSEESCDLDLVAAMAEALVEELDIDMPFVCSWAYTCSKMRPGEFGGGAFVVRRGCETVWVDAVHEALARPYTTRRMKNET